MIPYGHQSIDDDDIAAVVEVLRGDWLTQGPAVERFETELASRVGARFAVAFSSGTAALHAACDAAQLGPGDTVGVPALTFSASAACALYVGATPVLLDIDPATLNVDPSAVPSGLTALVAVHYAGLPVRLDDISNRPRVVIEDASHAVGATTPDGPVGSCAHSDLCCFSFHPVKTITTGEGGAVTTNDAVLADRLRRFRCHGTVPKHDVDGDWYYEVDELGFNYRLTDIQAALGTSQLAKLDRFLDARRRIAADYDATLHPLVVRPPQATNGFEHAYHLYAARVPDRRRLFDELRSAGVGVQVHYVPLYRHPVYRQPPDRFPGTEAAYSQLVSLPIYPRLSDDDQAFVVKLIGELLG